MKKLWLIVCDTDFDKYCYISKSDYTESFEQCYQISGHDSLSIYIDLMETIDNYTLEIPDNIDNLDKLL